MGSPVTTGFSKWKGFSGDSFVTVCLLVKNSPPGDACWFTLEGHLEVAKSTYESQWFFKRTLETGEGKRGGLAPATLLGTIIATTGKTCALQLSVAVVFCMPPPPTNSSSF